MQVPLGNDVHVNVAHIALLSGIQKARNHPAAHELKLLLVGGHEHTVMGPEKDMRALHDRLVKALDQLGP